jgi:hypothetical protein
METIVLPARPGATRSERPPVEIYLGTEPAQYRANRVFVWSIEKVRDPGREVRIHVMSELPGFDRKGWTTGFTNYRFAIPAFQEGQGRAIYNDEDQIYLTDPGVLFDLDLGRAAHLSISDTESSVMLISARPRRRRGCGATSIRVGTRGTRSSSRAGATSSTTRRSTHSRGAPSRSASSTSAGPTHSCGTTSSGRRSRPASNSSVAMPRAVPSKNISNVCARCR